MKTGLPEGFVYADAVIDDVALDLKYFGHHNFVGTVVDGYRATRLILTEAAAAAAGRVQEELRLFELGLKVFDGYRPQRAVNHFIRWAQDDDYSTQAEFFPGRTKIQIFDEGYVSKRSSHSRGSTLDLTIVSLDDGQELDMGTAFDFFGPASWPLWPQASQNQKRNRLLLRGIMGKHGFEPHDYEWWHFTLVEEPFPDTYFDFEVA